MATIPASCAKPLTCQARTRSTVLLNYTHFSVRLMPARRLAAMTGVNIDGKSLVPLQRSGTWHYDSRVPQELQTGPDVYQHNDLDRGHLVRRLDPVWGDDPTARPQTRTPSHTRTRRRRPLNSTKARNSGQAWKTMCSTTPANTTPESAFLPDPSSTPATFLTAGSRYPGNSGRLPPGPWMACWPRRASCWTSPRCWGQEELARGHPGTAAGRRAPAAWAPTAPSRCPCGTSQPCPEWRSPAWKTRTGSPPAFRKARRAGAALALTGPSAGAALTRIAAARDHVPVKRAGAGRIDLRLHVRMPPKLVPRRLDTAHLREFTARFASCRRDRQLGCPRHREPQRRQPAAVGGLRRGQTALRLEAPAPRLRDGRLHELQPGPGKVLSAPRQALVPDQGTRRGRRRGHPRHRRGQRRLRQARPAGRLRDQDRAGHRARPTHARAGHRRGRAGQDPQPAAQRLHGAAGHFPGGEPAAAQPALPGPQRRAPGHPRGRGGPQRRAHARRTSGPCMR